MGHFVKWAGVGVAAVLLLALVVLLVTPYVVNLERYRSLLANRASRALGREVTLGALRVSLWSGLGAEAQGIRVAPRPGFGPEPLVAAEALRVRVQLLPLLKGQIKVSTATLERPRIRLVRSAEGEWGIEDLFKPAAQPPPTRPAPDAARAPKAPLLGGILLSEVDVKNGEVTVLDQAGNSRLTTTVRDVNLSLRQANLADPIQVRGRGRVGEDGGQVELSGRVLLEADTVNLDLALSLREVAASLLQALLLGPGNAVELTGRLSGDAKISGLPARVAVAGALELKPLGVRAGPVAKPVGEDGRLTFALQRADAGLRVSQLEVRLKELSLDATARIPDLQHPEILFDAATPRLDLDRLLAPARPRTTWLGPAAALAAPAARAPATAGVPIQGRLRVADLRYAGLGWSSVEGEVRYHAGVLTIPAAQAGFMQGRVAVSGELDFRAPQPRAALKSRITDVATEPVVKALATGAWTLQSRLSGSTDLRFSGASREAILGSAAGTGALRLADGRLVDYKPLDRLADAIGPILAAQGIRTRLNEFQQLSGTFSVDKGVLRTQDLTLTKPEGTVTAAGSLGLLDSTVDLDVTARLGRTTVEAKVTGTTAQPTVVPKLGRLQQKLERELDKVLPGEQGKSLKDLFRSFFPPK